MNAATKMQSRQRLANSLRDEKLACVAAGDIAGLGKLMVLTDDIMSGRHDVSNEIESMSDDELLANLSA